jgi:hypothetical protein
VASIDNPEDGESVVAALINQDYFDTIKSVTSTIIVGEKGRGENTVTFSIIGDSYTQGAFFKDALLKKDYVPNIKMIGLRDVFECAGQADEGRGGWTLNKYFTVTNKRTDAYNGFCQPDGNYKYWGATAFWQLANAIRLHPETEWTFGEKYNAGRFGAQSLNFDEVTGYKKDPKKNDIMFDNAQDAYV